MKFLHDPSGSLSLIARAALACFAATIISFDADAEVAPRLERVKYNNPGLVVDLGVGLWAWPLPMDFNGDGRLDLVVSCPDKPSNGLYVFENAGPDPKFPIFKPARRISKGLQNVQVSFVNGTPRVLSPGNEYPDFLRTGFEKPERLSLPENIHTNKVRANTWRYLDYDADGALDLIVGIDDATDYGWDNAYDPSGRWTNGPLRGFVYFVRNTGTSSNPTYALPAKILADGKPVETYGWPSPNFADFDGDGDLDLLCGEFLDGFTYFKNVGTRSAPRFLTGQRLTNSKGNPLAMDLQMITPTAIDWDGDGDFDLIVGDEDGRVALIEHTGRKSKDGLPVFHAPLYFKQEADDVKCGALATPVGVDWDGDGDIDLVSGNTAGYVEFFENLSKAGVERPRWAAPRRLVAGGKVLRIMAGTNGSIQGPCEAKWGYTTLSVADWDHDKLPDLVVNSIWGKVIWYRNVGSRKRPKLAAAQPIKVAWDTPQPKMTYGWLRPTSDALLTQWRTTPVVVDWNRDGLNDLVMMDPQGYLSLFLRRRTGEGRHLELAPPQRVFHGENLSVSDSRNKTINGAPGVLQLNRESAGRSGRRKLCATDWDGDGLLDLLVNSSNANWLRQTGARNGIVYLRDEGPLSVQNIEGHDVSPTVVDWNADGVPDFVGGAEDGKFYYLRNPRSK